jgi:hypothetical protein
MTGEDPRQAGIDVSAIVNKSLSQQREEIQAFLDGVIGDFEMRAEKRPVLLNMDTSLTFELPIDIAGILQEQLSKACEQVELQLGDATPVSIFPPADGTVRFELTVEKDGTSINLPDVKTRLVKALETMAP